MLPVSRGSSGWCSYAVRFPLGQRVKMLVDEHPAAGHNTVMWDGRNEDGHEVASGIYFYGMEAGAFNETKSMVLLK